MKATWYHLMLLTVIHSAYAMNYPIQVGDQRVTVQKIQHGAGKSFIHLHHNETTALKAAKSLVSKEGGTVITLLHAGGRNIVFHLQKQRYEFDPNRMFTDIGIKKTLQQFGNYSLAAHREVKKLSDQVKRLLPEGKIIAVHNNNAYSLKDYLPGNSLSNDAKDLNYQDKPGFRNFYLVTQQHDFNRLNQFEFNSILQATQATDDGSLSIYLANAQYVNVEAGYDQLAAQIKMLKYA